jgi:hypothetical protein
MTGKHSGRELTLITAEQIDRLVKHSSPHSVSLWLPTHRAGDDRKQDPIRMKNLLGQAESRLAEAGLRPPEAAERITPMRKIAADGEFWRHQSAGLGVFLGDGRPMVLHAPVEVPEVVCVGEHYYVKPLFGRMHQDLGFYLLRLSKNRVKLYRAGRYDMEEVDLLDAPDSFEDFLRADEFEPHLDYHSGVAAHDTATRRPLKFHGQGDAAEDRYEKKRLSNFCRWIDAEVAKAVYQEHAPLLLAATEPLQGMYRQVSSCRELDGRGVTLNPDDAGEEALHRRAVEVRENDFARLVEDAVERFGTAGGAGMAEGELEAVLRAGHARAIDTLLVREDRELWGRFDGEQGHFEQHEQRRPGDEDLLNLAAVLAARGGGQVYAVEGEKVPGAGPAAAVLRFRPQA